MILTIPHDKQRKQLKQALSNHNFLVHAHAKLPNPHASIRIYQTTLLLIDEEAITINFWDQLRDLKNSRANFSVIIIQNQSTQIESSHLAYIDYVLHKPLQFWQVIQTVQKALPQTHLQTRLSYLSEQMLDLHIRFVDKQTAYQA